MFSIDVSGHGLSFGNVPPWTTAVVGVFAGYVALCKGLRYLRRDQQHSQRPYKTREDFQKMTAEDAWQIIKYVLSLEFPFTAKKALEFALFKYVGSVCSPIPLLNVSCKDLRDSYNLEAIMRDATTWQSRIRRTTLRRYEHLDLRVPDVQSCFRAGEFSYCAHELLTW